MNHTAIRRPAMLGSQATLLVLGLMLTPAKAADLVCSGCVGTSDIASDAITTPKIRNNAIRTVKILDGAVTTPKVRDGAISGAKLRNGAVSTGKIGNNAITSAKIRNRSVRAVDIHNEVMDRIGALEVVVAGLPPGVLTAGGYDSRCTLSGTALSGGRNDWELYCTEGVAVLSLNVITGAIAGHPYESNLTSAGIDQLNGWENHSWGIIAGGQSTYDFWGCMNAHFDTNDVVSLRQVGDRLNISRYGTDNVHDCSASISLDAP